MSESSQVQQLCSVDNIYLIDIKSRTVAGYNIETFVRKMTKFQLYLSRCKIYVE